MLQQFIHQFGRPQLLGVLGNRELIGQIRWYRLYGSEQSLFRYGLDELTDRLLQAVKDKVGSIRLLLVFLCPSDWIEDKNGRMLLFIDSK